MSKCEILRRKQVDHIRDEHKLHRVLKNPGVVSLATTFQDQHSLYMLMEFVPGGELFDRIPETGMQEDAARFYICELILAVSYLHERDIVHRDIKPENVLIDSAGHIKLTDFGFAKVIRERAVTFCGTPEYMAPEMITKRGHTKTADWWAVGILLFELLCGASPFFGDSPYEIYERIISSNIRYPKDMSHSAKQLISGLLRRDPEKRLGARTASELRSHEFFSGISWDAYEKRTVAAPWTPDLESALDSHYFHSQTPLFSPAEDVPVHLTSAFSDF